MSSAQPQEAKIWIDADRKIHFTGDWRLTEVVELEKQVDNLPWPRAAEQVWDMTEVSAMDTAGAWLLQRTRAGLQKRGSRILFQGLRPEFSEILEWVAEDGRPALAGFARTAPPALERIGRSVWQGWLQASGFLSFLGESVLIFARLAATVHRIRWRSVFYNLKAGGLDAVPIVGLLSFLMGIVIAYQAAVQLRPFGADVFIVEFVGIAMLREIAPVITAIIVAGRSGSAYAAQIGTMKVTEEIDALRTIGIGTVDLLVAPKVLALMIALPLLTAFADITGVFGGMVVASTQLSVGFNVFLSRFKTVISPTNYLIGIGKAPVFAAIIAMIGCYQGLRVSGSAESVGRQTTVSVVQSIFLVIVFDALFSILLSWMGIGLFAR